MENQHTGYNGKILRVDLSSGMTRVEEIDESFCRRYIGGAGFTAYYLLNEMKPNTDPLGPGNRLVFALGPLSGIALPGSGRHCVGALSPLTGGIAKSEVGEFFGAQLKRAGFDAIIIDGKSEHPVYLWIHDGEAEIKDASRVWGKETKETQEGIQADLGNDHIRTAMIGPAGERMVKYACIMHGLFNAAGRCGLGAVMGSKNLKAIAVKGSKRPTVKDPNGVKELKDWLLTNLKMLTGLSDFGTTPAMPRYVEIGNLPVNNFRDGTFPGVDKISAQAVKDTIRVGMDACFGCPIRCKKRVAFNEPFHVDGAYGGPEYETLAALGSNCGIDDLKAIAKASELCNAYAMDTISTGSTIAFAMECFENGIIDETDTGGIKLAFGNVDAMLQMIHLIAERKGFGDLLAEGSARAAEQIGNGAEAFAMHVKKQEIPMHDPRLNRAMGVGYAINPDGPDHCCNLIEMVFSAYAAEPDIVVKDADVLGLSAPVPFYDLGSRKIDLLRFVRMKRFFVDSLVLCLMLPYSLEQLIKVTADVTGWNLTLKEVLLTVERTMTMCQLINIRQGFTSADDRLPSRFFKPMQEGPLAENPALDSGEFERAKRQYYETMGWDHNGIPTIEILRKLDIDSSTLP